MTKIWKIGLYGGTFNPIHNGHLRVINHVKKRFRLDTVHLIPSARPPHKSMENLASAKDRLQMVQKAISNFPGLMASDMELKRRGSSYTIDTLRQFACLKNCDASGSSMDIAAPSIEGTDSLSPYFILGTDAFFDMETWKESRDIFRTACLIVMIRAGDPRTPLDILDFLKKKISHRYIPAPFPLRDIRKISPFDNGFTEKSPCETRHHDYISSDCVTLMDKDPINPEYKVVHICNVPEIDISSTEIRKRIHQKKSISGLVPEDVERFITQKGLYFDK